ncbi:hypothetical protein QCA50_010300 [Cerrena zonata]|uniref:Uncharacterized protein n=1 Tax=Cerrena zonata TaxID=2478898 RepID=A0AAW0FZS9_9APHY
MAPPPPSYVTYFWRDPSGTIELATLLESRTTIEGGTTGLKTWPASLTLASYLIKNPDIVRNKRVLELGCGAGLLGIVAATVQSSRTERGTQTSITLTDVRPDVLERCQHNFQLPCNKSSRNPHIRVETLDWEESSSQARAHSDFQTKLAEMDAELVLGADIVFDPDLIPALASTLVSVLQPPRPNSKQREALIALTLRNPDTLASFLHAAEERLHLEKIAFEENDNPFLGVSYGTEKQNVQIYKMRNKMQ